MGGEEGSRECEMRGQAGWMDGKRYDGEEKEVQVERKSKRN